MAQFKTAYLQRAIPMDVAVVGALTAGTRKADIHVNDLVTYTPAAGTAPAYIAKAASLAAATHVVALTDQTVGDGTYIHTDVMDYKPSPLVAATVATGTTPSATSKVKKVALYPIYEKDDIILDADGNDLSA